MELSKKQQIRRILSDGQIHHGSELVAITHRFNDAIDRLRKEDGLEIKTLYLDGYNKMAWYQLVSISVPT